MAGSLKNPAWREAVRSRNPSHLSVEPQIKAKREAGTQNSVPASLLIERLRSGPVEASPISELFWLFFQKFLQLLESRLQVADPLLQIHVGQLENFHAHRVIVTL